MRTTLDEQIGFLKRLQDHQWLQYSAKYLLTDATESLIVLRNLEEAERREKESQRYDYELTWKQVISIFSMGVCVGVGLILITIFLI